MCMLCLDYLSDSVHLMHMATTLGQCPSVELHRVTRSTGQPLDVVSRNDELVGVQVKMHEELGIFIRFDTRWIP